MVTDAHTIRVIGYDQLSKFSGIGNRYMLAFHHIIIIALIQGITEFLPVSSSGHLVLLPALSGFADQGQVIDVAAHIGTLGAVCLYFRQDCWHIAGSMLFARKSSPDVSADRKLGWLLILASIPVMIAGLIIEILDPAMLRLAITVAAANIIFALWLFYADKSASAKPLSAITTGDALKIGIAQILALIPGTSRSGVTMTMGRYLGYDRVSVARFSLLLSIPVIVAAGAVKSISLIKSDNLSLTIDAVLVALLSFATALLAIRLMMGWLAKADFKIFVYYRLALGVVLIGLLAMGVI